MKTKGLLVFVYKRDGLDCSANGISSCNKTLILTSVEDLDGGVEMIAPVFTGCQWDSVKIIENVPGHYCAVPITPTPKGMVGPMFGGNFIYSSDSRFPFPYPIPIHDRYETQKCYNTLST